MAPTWRRFPARGLLARLALFALFAVALVLLRDALSERWRAGEDRARAFFQGDTGAASAPVPDAAGEGAP
jgi:hypothetical protein